MLTINQMLIETSFQCAVCGERNETTIDASAGEMQHYTEDCLVCCHPNSLSVILITDENGRVVSAKIQSEYEE